MKNFFYKIFVAFTMTLLFMACSKNETKITAAPPSKGSTLTASSTNIVLQNINADATTALMLKWDTVTFGGPLIPAATYTLQIDSVGNNFSSPQNMPMGNNLDSSITVSKLNQIAQGAAKIVAGNTGTIEIRIKADLNQNAGAASTVQSVYSNVISITIKTYASIAWVYVPGAYQGWNPSTADSLISFTGNNVYQGIIYFTPGNLDFKITPAKNWNLAYGDAGNGSLSTSGGNITATAAGSYQIIADLNKLTYSMAYYQWSIIGDATIGGWSTDTDMKYNNGDSTWNVTTTLVPGGLKFRKNHDWGTNFGGNSSTGGALVSGGNNINITAAGTYSIILNIPSNTYTVTKQ